MHDSPSLWPYLIPALPGFVLAAGTALGIWWSKRGVVAAQDLTIVQIDVARAAVGKTEAETLKTKAEAESVAVASIAKALEVADKTVDKLMAERDALERQIEIYKAERRLAERRPLEEELKRLPEK